MILYGNSVDVSFFCGYYWWNSSNIRYISS